MSDTTQQHTPKQVHQIAPPEIELKAVKALQQASDETLCFEASVYLDGKKVGTVGNRGQGGPNFYHMDRTDEARLADLCSRWISHRWGQKAIEPADTVIALLVDDFEDRKVARRLNRKGCRVVALFESGWSSWDEQSQMGSPLDGWFEERWIVGFSDEHLAREHAEAEKADQYRVLINTDA
jgi:hypothetical protein